MPFSILGLIIAENPVKMNRNKRVQTRYSAIRARPDVVGRFMTPIPSHKSILWFLRKFVRKCGVRQGAGLRFLPSISFKRPRLGFAARCSGKLCFPGKLSPIPAAMPPGPRHSLGFVIYKSPGNAEPFRTSKGKAQESVAHKKKIATIAGQIPDFRLYDFKY